MNKTATQTEVMSNEYYRDMLLEKKHSVLTSLGMKCDMSVRLGRVAEEDQAPISHDEFVISRLNSLEYTHLRLVNEALDRLETGDYGVCLACERPIAIKRLRALPWARYCVSCQEQVSIFDPQDREDSLARPALS